jgi:hypothetical protein
VVVGAGGAGGRSSYGNYGTGGSGGAGAVRLIWGSNRSYPSTNTANATIIP